MFVDFFIKRPVFATVCAVVMVLAGLVVIPYLPIAQYPEIAPPQVGVTSAYIGANAQTVESGVTTPLEQQINGVEGMKYISSTSTNDGVSQINITFDLERDLDLAAVDVQNRVKLAEPRLPQEVINNGIVVSKSSNALVLVFGLYAENGQYDDLYISNYADRYIRDELKRIKGVGNIEIFGERKYAMRIWLDPNKLAARGLTPLDVARALQEQNVQVAAGQIGQPPTNQAQSFQFSVVAQGRLKSAEQFDEIILRGGPDGSTVRLKDVARTQLGAENYSSSLRFNGKEAVGIGVFQLSNANALDLATQIRAKLEQLQERFPPGLKYRLAFDTTMVIAESIKEVVFTLAFAILLVLIVMYLFLQSWRATLIPFVTIPVSLIGTFAFMKIFGFSINTLTMFGLTLATGLVVDDAIVVIENIERYMREKGMTPVEAASAAMKEISSALIAISLALVAVFVPVAFFPGTTGQLYKQFALTITFSIVLSTFNALTFTPALSAVLLRLEDHDKKFKFLKWFDHKVNGIRDGFKQSLEGIVHLKVAVIGVFAILLVLTGVLFNIVPKGFVPAEDQSWFMIIVQGPDGTSINHTNRVLNEIDTLINKQEDVLGSFAVTGYSFTGNAPNKATVFVTMKPLEERKRADQSTRSLINKLYGPLSGIPGASIFPIEPPAIMGLGQFGGFEFQLKDETGDTPVRLAEKAYAIMGAAMQSQDLSGVFTTYSVSDPQVKLDVDRQKAQALGVPISEIYNTLQIYLGSIYVNDFDFLNRIYRVYVQADESYRSKPEDINRFYVRSQMGNMVPLANLVSLQKIFNPQSISHYNLSRATMIQGNTKPGVSQEQGMKAMEKIANSVLAEGMSYEWTGIALEQVQSGGQTAMFFILGLVFVFLVLAAQYENFIDPVIILLSVPLAVLGALLSLIIRGWLDPGFYFGLFQTIGALQQTGNPMIILGLILQFFQSGQNDVFCQVGLVMLIGLASKNSILIVEFANHLREQGMHLTDAAIEAAKTRFRPIVMTSLAFIVGVFPLVIASGAGSAARNSMGTAVFGGMIVSTFLSLFIVPVIYVVVHQLLDRFRKHRLPTD